MRTWKVAALALVLTGCVAVRPGVDHRRPIATELVAKPTVAVVVRGSSIEREMTVSEMGKEFAEWVASVERAFNDSGLFGDVSIGLHPAARRARVDIVREQDVDQTAFTLNGLTWGLLPLTWSAQYSVKVELVAEDGTASSFESREAQRVWMQTILLPVMPIASPKVQGVEAIYDLTLDALATAQQAGSL